MTPGSTTPEKLNITPCGPRWGGPVTYSEDALASATPEPRDRETNPLGAQTPDSANDVTLRFLDRLDHEKAHTKPEWPEPPAMSDDPRAASQRLFGSYNHETTHPRLTFEGAHKPVSLDDVLRAMRGPDAAPLGPQDISLPPSAWKTVESDLVKAINQLSLRIADLVGAINNPRPTERHHMTATEVHAELLDRTQKIVSGVEAAHRATDNSTLHFGGREAP